MHTASEEWAARVAARNEIEVAKATARRVALSARPVAPRERQPPQDGGGAVVAVMLGAAGLVLAAWAGLGFAAKLALEAAR